MPRKSEGQVRYNGKKTKKEIPEGHRCVQEQFDQIEEAQRRVRKRRSKKKIDSIEKSSLAKNAFKRICRSRRPWEVNLDLGG